MIVIERSKLLNTLQKLNIPTLKSSFPILSTVLIEIEEEKIKFTTTNLELTVISQIKVLSRIRQSFCVSLVKFLSILKEFSEERVSLSLQKNFLWITCENCEFKLNIIEAAEFPKIPVLKDKQVIKINSPILREMINFTNFSVFIGEANYVLTGFFCEIEGRKIKFTTSDTKRLSTIERELAPTQPLIQTKKSFIIPHRTIIELNRLLKEEEEVKLIIGENQICFDLDNTQIISQLIQGDFPDYQKYIPQDSEYKLKVNRQRLSSSLKRASILSAPEYQGVKLEIKKDKLVISKHTPQLGEYKEEIEAEFKGKELALGFNPQYLIDVLKVIEEEEVIFDVYSPEKPLVLRSNGFIYLALPMRLS